MMVEAIGSEVFGTVSLSTFEYICAYAFILYPLVSLPLLAYYWMKSAGNGLSGSLVGFKLPSALKQKQESAFVSPLEGGTLQDQGEYKSEDNSAYVQRHLKAQPINDVKPNGGGELISSTGRHKITFIGQRNRKNVSLSNLNRASLNTEVKADVSVDDSDNLIAAARKVALSSESTAELRAAALDFLISSQSRDRLCRQKTSLRGSSNDPESFASSF